MKTKEEKGDRISVVLCYEIVGGKVRSRGEGLVLVMVQLLIGGSRTGQLMFVVHNLDVNQTILVNFCGFHIENMG